MGQVQKGGSLLRHIPVLDIYVSAPPPPPPGLNFLGFAARLIVTHSVENMHKKQCPFIRGEGFCYARQSHVSVQCPKPLQYKCDIFRVDHITCK